MQRIVVINAPKQSARDLQEIIRTPDEWKRFFYVCSYKLVKEEEGFLVIRKKPDHYPPEELFVCIADGLIWGLDLEEYLTQVLEKAGIFFMFRKEYIRLWDPSDHAKAKRLFQKAVEEQRELEQESSQ
jgi:hypothetical protein